jgi:hypothetical protein
MRRFTEAEKRFVEKNRALSRKDLHALFVKQFERQVSIHSLKYLCQLHGWFNERSGKSTPGPAGSEYISNGYIMINIGCVRADGKVGHRRWIEKHRLLWEKIHGPIPKGHILKCLDGDRLNCDPSNWECVTRGMIPRLNGRGFDVAPSELKPTIMAVAKLEYELVHARAKRD